MQTGEFCRLPKTPKSEFTLLDNGVWLLTTSAPIRCQALL